MILKIRSRHATNVLAFAGALGLATSCKLMKTGDSATKSVDAIESGDASLRWQEPCGGDGAPHEFPPATRDGALQALKTVYDLAPELFRSADLFGIPAGEDFNKGIARYVTLVDSEKIKKICGGVVERKKTAGVDSAQGVTPDPNKLKACWDIAGLEKDGAANLAETPASDRDQRSSAMIYIEESPEAVHGNLLAMMTYALLESTTSDKQECEKTVRLVEDGIKRGSSDEAMKSSVAALQAELPKLKQRCAQIKSPENPREAFAYSVLKDKLVTEQDAGNPHPEEVIKALLAQFRIDVAEPDFLERAAKHPSVQNLLMAESIDSFYCSRATNDALLSRFPLAWAYIENAFGRPKAFQIQDLKRTAAKTDGAKDQP